MTLGALGVLTVSLALASACGGGTAGPSPSPVRQATTGIVWQAVEAPGDAIAGTLLVVAQDGVPSEFDRAGVTVTRSTTWRDVDGDRIDAPRLGALAGRRVAVGITGTVRESYPVQVDAATIRLLEPLDVSVNATPAGPPTLDGTAVELVRDTGGVPAAVRVRGDDGAERDVRLGETTGWLLETPTELKPVARPPLIGNGLEAPLMARVEAGEAVWVLLRLP